LLFVLCEETEALGFSDLFKATRERIQSVDIPPYVRSLLVLEQQQQQQLKDLSQRADLSNKNVLGKSLKTPSRLSPSSPSSSAAGGAVALALGTTATTTTTSTTALKKSISGGGDSFRPKFSDAFAAVTSANSLNSFSSQNNTNLPSPKKSKSE
jgi:hypothetical protein